MVNLEELPLEIKNEIEDQSLEILEPIKEKIIVIGGWGVRAHLGPGHYRYTLDVDGICDLEKLAEIRDELHTMDLSEREIDWGIQFFKDYRPSVNIGDRLKVVKSIQLRVELSPPRIEEKDSNHFFEFSLDDYVFKEIGYHSKDKHIRIKVPPIEHMTAVKLGLPVDYKNCFDAAMLLRQSGLDKVIQIIKDNDDWNTLVLRRMPKLKGRIRQKNSLENILARTAGLDMRNHLARLDYIENSLKQ